MKELPSDLHAEEMVLAAAFKDPSILETVSPDHFTTRRHQVVYRTISVLASRGDAIDDVTVSAEILRNNEHETANFTFVMELKDSAGAAIVQGPQYVKQLKTVIARRRIAIDAHNLSEDAALDTADIKALRRKADAIADDLARADEKSAPLIPATSEIPPIGEAAFIGLPGRFVQMIEQHTEADRNWMLLLFLVYAGNIIGRSAYVVAAADKHYTNLFACAVGATAGGRKGSATSAMDLFFKKRKYEPTLGKVIHGVSSGEGVCWQIRDDIRKPVLNKTEWLEEVTEKGVDDKRLLIVLSEMRQLFDQARREGNTLTSIIRNAWDGIPLESPTKNSDVKVAEPHISISANITRAELLRKMDESDAAAGLLNRFIWCKSKASRILPEAGKLLELKLTSPDWEEIEKAFYLACAQVQHGEVEVKLDKEAQDLWGRNKINNGAGFYAELTSARPGIWGDVTTRRAQHVLRMAMIFAIFDDTPRLPGQSDKPVIRRRHLEAAMEIWRYCDACAFEIFGDSVGDPVADTILDALREAPNGLTITEILKGPLHGNVYSARAKQALSLLEQIKLVRQYSRPSRFKRITVWLATVGE